MLYVFHVDAGVMVTFDMSLTLQTVMTLKLAIEKKLKIPVDLIVLLVSGGDVLQAENLVSSYGAGTDSSPIFLFTKPSLKDNTFKQSSQYSVNFLSPIEELSACTEWSSNTGGEIKSVGELKAEVEMCRSLPPAVATVRTCAKVAQQFSECAQGLARSCEQLVHDQHLQHQGWTAVVANLEDIFNEFCERSKNFKETFKKHKSKREYYHNKMSILNDVLESLGKIPMLPSLQLNAEAHRFSAFDVFEEGISERHYLNSSDGQSYSSDNKALQDFTFKMSEEEVFESSNKSDEKTAIHLEADTSEAESVEGVQFKGQSSETKDPTLLHWILAQGNKDALQDILDYCRKGISLIDEDPLKERETELRNILEYANLHGLKQIKGIEGRLHGLDQLLNNVKKLERDQHDQATALIQNRDRVSTSCDPSVLPTLVQSHRCQLEKLLKNHETLVDIKRRIARSKEELSHILKARLEAVLTIENSMSVQDAHQMLSFQCFNRLSRYFEIVDQLHRAPAIFTRAVHEVARRRKFSDAYMQWAISIASRLLRIHNEEVSRRQDFNEVFDGHFLRSLFPGMADMPPGFATQAPPPFDTRLPKLSDVDAELISGLFPDLLNDLPKHDMESIVQYLQQQIKILECDDKISDEQTDIEKGQESETETGDFEKLSRQSTSERQKTDTSTTCVPETAVVSTITEDNMDTHKLSMEKLKAFLIRLHELCKLNIIFIREEIMKLQKQMNEQKEHITQECIDIVKACEKSNEQIALNFREETQRMTVDHELELSDMKEIISNKDEEINTLKLQVEQIKLEHNQERERDKIEQEKITELLENIKDEVKEYELKLQEAEATKQKEIKEMQDKMHLDYKAEIESMRSRFRLVALTSTDRSPSESSLEKIERTDVIEITNHNSIIMQTKENAEVEKEEAVKKAIEECEKKWQMKMEEEIMNLKDKHEIENQLRLRDATRRLIAEKDRQIETFREREVNLTRECAKYKETIQQLTDPETNDYDRLLKTQLATAENENALLVLQIKELKKELELKTESEKKDGDSEATVSSSSKNEAQKRYKRSHTPLGLAAGTITLSACLPGNTVLVMWDPAHDNYTVMQESTVMFFVHSDCLQALDLSVHVKNESERRLYAIGVVESKEFCYAKKSTNRYHMPRTSRFYRVRVKPAKVPAPTCCSQRHSHDGLKPVKLSLLTDRPVKKWLTYLHAPDIQKSGDSQTAGSSTSEDKPSEVATGTLINLESPEGARGIQGPARTSFSEDQLDSIEANVDCQIGRMQQSTVSNVTDMECSVGRVVLGSPQEAAIEPQIATVVESELAEEATP